VAQTQSTPQLIVLCAIGIAVMETKDPVQRPVFVTDTVRGGSSNQPRLGLPSSEFARCTQWRT
jgi:hypothetical protein